MVENIRFFGGIYGLSDTDINDKAEKLIANLDLHAQRNKLVGGLPLGWKQKLSFSVAVLHDPKIVFLDEPTGGVDPVTRRQFWDLIYEKTREGMTVFITTHYMDEAEYCTRLSVMVDGEIKALGPPSSLRAEYHADSMDEVFLKLARHAQRGD